jgi:hypothetical protein
VARTPGGDLARRRYGGRPRFPDPADKDVVYLEADTSALYLEKPEDVSRYSVMIDYLRAQALGPAESRALIAQMAGRVPD